MNDSRETRYMAAWNVAKKLGLTALALSKLTSTLMIEINSSKKANIGLNLKFEGKKLKVLGYSEKNDTGWEFSSKAVELIQAYLNAFPSIQIGLRKPPAGNFYTASDFFHGTSASAEVASVMKWLKDSGVKDLVTVPLSTTALSVSAVSELSHKLDFYLNELENAKFEEILVKGVPRTHLLKPTHAMFRLQGQTFTLGDRILYCLEQGFIPLGAQGTIIGVEGQLLEIMFDCTVIGGTTLGNRCKEGRGLVCDNIGILNLTSVQPPDSAKAPRKEPAQSAVNRSRETNPSNANANAWKSQSPKIREPPSDRLPKQKSNVPQVNHDKKNRPIAKSTRSDAFAGQDDAQAGPQNIAHYGSGIHYQGYAPNMPISYPVQTNTQPSQELNEILNVSNGISTMGISNDFLSFLNSKQGSSSPK